MSNDDGLKGHELELLNHETRIGMLEEYARHLRQRINLLIALAGFMAGALFYTTATSFDTQVRTFGGNTGAGWFFWVIIGLIAAAIAYAVGSPKDFLQFEIERIRQRRREEEARDQKSNN